MPYQSRHTGTLADLLLRQGDFAADKAARSGQMWGNVARGVATIPMGIQQRRAAQAEAQQAQIDREIKRADTLSQIQERGAARDERNNARMDEQGAKDLALTTQKVSAWLGDIASAPDPESMKMAYKVGRDALVSEGRLTAQDAPEFFPGQSWVKARMTQLLPAAERFKAMFPEPKAQQVLSPGSQMRDAEGNLIAEAPFAPRAPRAPVSLSPGGRLVDPETGKVIAEGAPPREPAGARTPVWVVQDGKYVDLAGVAPPGSQPSNVREQARPVTGAERKTLGFFQRMLEAERNARAVEDSVGGQDFAAEWMPGEWLENFAKTSAGQRYTQAQRTFTEARLRKESGAAIPQGEYDTDRATNFKRPNDDGKSVAQKRAARLRLLRSAANEAGRSLGEYYGEGATVDSILSEFDAPEAKSGVMVNMRAPDRTIKPVPAEQVEYYKSKGAKVVGQ